MFRDRTTLIVILLVTTTGCYAQSPNSSVIFTSGKKHITLHEGMMFTLKTVAANTTNPEAIVVPPGHFLETTLDHKIGGKNCRVGDPVQLSLVYPVTFEANGATVRIPEHASIVGHVVYFSERDAQHEVSKLAVVADTIYWEANHAVLPAVVASAKQPPVRSRSIEQDYHDAGVRRNAAAVAARSAHNRE